MKLSKFTIIILLSAIFISGCNSVKKALTGERKSSDEFFVKKKNPLVLPPNFDDLPQPATEKNEVKIKSEDIDLSSVLIKSKNSKQIIKQKDKSLERSISKILSSN